MPTVLTHSYMLFVGKAFIILIKVAEDFKAS